jgi:hypothetical protein
MEAPTATAADGSAAALNERRVLLLILIVEVAWLVGIGFALSLIV